MRAAARSVTDVLTVDRDAIDSGAGNAQNRPGNIVFRVKFEGRVEGQRHVHFRLASLFPKRNGDLEFWSLFIIRYGGVLSESATRNLKRQT